MRKLKLQIQTSIDGYIADVNGKTDWMVWNWGPEWTWDHQLRNYFNDLKASIDCVLLSRKMAVEGFIHHWAEIAKDSNNPQSGFAKNITKAKKIVFTKTLSKSEWPNTELATGDLVTEINQLKNQSGKDIIVYGGAAFVSALIQAGLIDEYHLFVNPTILGNGKAIFRSLEDKQNLSLVKSISFECDVAVLCYRPKRK